jgi:hypothetical protein
MPTLMSGKKRDHVSTAALESVLAGSAVAQKLGEILAISPADAIGLSIMVMASS